MSRHAPKRSYTLSALEDWFGKLSGGWEEHFSADDLDGGRRLYREGHVRELDLQPGTAIVHCRIEKEAHYAVVEWMNGHPDVRQSMEDGRFGRCLAAAGLYEIEELVADEISPLPPEGRNGHKGRNAHDPSAEAPTAEKTVPDRPARPLRLEVKATEQGLLLRAFWKVDGGRDEAAHPKHGATSATHLVDAERERLIRLTALAHKAAFEYRESFGDYILRTPEAIVAFLGEHLGKWKRYFELSLDEGARAYAAGVQEVELVATADESSPEGDHPQGIGLSWEARLGERVLPLALCRKLMKRGGRVHFLPGVGMLRLPQTQADFLSDFHHHLAEGGKGALPPYLLFSLFGQDTVVLKLTPKLEAWRQRLLSPPEAAAADYPAFLRPYQRGGVSWIEHLSGNDCHGLLADEMGLGKTVQVATVLARKGLADRSHLVVCPASVVPVWRRELERFFPHIPVEVLRTGNRFEDRSEPALWLSSYSQLRRHRPALEKHTFGFAVLDEAQMIKNPEAKVTQACLAIRCEHRLALTGTPLENREEDVWTLFRFLMPGLLGSRRRFAELAAREPEALGERLRRQIAPFVLRRTKSEVARELPEKVEVELSCPLTPLQKRVYDRLAREGVRQVGDDLKAALQEQSLSLLTLLTRLRQAACDPGLVPGQRAGQEHSGKLNLLEEKLSEVIAAGSKAVVFSQFVSLLERVKPVLARAFPTVPVHELTGRTLDRSKPVNAFQEHEGPALMLVSLKAGGTGITLHAADYVFLLDPWWNPAVENQAIDRVHRIGQDKTVFVYRMVSAGTIEQRVQALQKSKRELFDQVVGSLSDIGGLDASVQSLSELILRSGESSEPREEEKDPEGEPSGEPGEEPSARQAG